MANKIRILLVEDSESLALVYKEYLRGDNYDVTYTNSGLESQNLLSKKEFDIVLLDLQLPDIHGSDVLKYIQQEKIASTVIVITAHGSVDTAVDIMRLGAFDFITKPFNANRLLVTITNAIKNRELSKLVNNYKHNFERERYHGFIGKSLSMQAVYRMIESAAPSNATIFIKGESGVGKELCALAIHQESTRNNKPFIAINCAAIPKDLIESELFGHVKGAFTGAHKDRAGAAAQAHTGTLFLDEIGELDYALQSKLLRFIQTGTYNKIGSDKLETVDIRIICATNRDPLVEVQEGRFREDLYYRLHVIPIELPSLNEREQDIMLLANFFLSKYSDEENKSFDKFDSDVISAFEDYQWPGNVRELQNTINNIVVLHDSNTVALKMLPNNITNVETIINKISDTKKISTSTKTLENDIQPLWLVEKNTIQNAIDFYHGNIQKAAAMLEVSASTLYRKIQSWEKNKTA